PSHTSGDGPVPVHALQAPAAHDWVPVEHSPTSVPHGRTRPSSMRSSQSLSSASQISDMGTPPPHTPSSMTPSQSSSAPLHASGGVAPHAPHALRRPSSIAPLQLSSTPSHRRSPGSAHKLGVLTPPGRSQ